MLSISSLAYISRTLNNILSTEVRCNEKWYEQALDGGGSGQCSWVERSHDTSLDRPTKTCVRPFGAINSRSSICRGTHVELLHCRSGWWSFSSGTFNRPQRESPQRK